MFKTIFSSYKTSLLGLVAAAFQAHAGGLTWHSIAASLPTALLGIFAKDADKTNAQNPGSAQSTNPS